MGENSKCLRAVIYDSISFNQKSFERVCKSKQLVRAGFSIFFFFFFLIMKNRVLSNVYKNAKIANI